MYTPTFIEVGTFIGTFGLFFTLFLLFTRVLPIISIGEVKSVNGFGRGSGHASHEPQGGHGAHQPLPEHGGEALPVPALAATALRKDLPV
jgi:molybdopterin-containing oxidoreductase family membrane subunit